ncbi:MAG: (d)CMP kinase [Actinobacteria bacterium QS_8_72_14]|nr:MAG: (d)CMP kinase [Actinobacteria bacterium QS_8_72_14]
MAVDGPSGSGKSTVAHQLADRLSVPHVDTGAYYRALTWAVLRHGVNTADAAACAELAQRVAITRASGRTYVNGEDVEDAIRGREATAAVSVVSAHPAVRRLLVARQRAAVGQTGAVVEGRDAGTVVVPEADLKVWLTASPHLRAARRAAQLGEEDADVIAATADELARRDDADAQQMARAADAAIVDTTGRDVAEVVAELAGRALSAAGASP